MPSKKNFLLYSILTLFLYVQSKIYNMGKKNDKKKKGKGAEKTAMKTEKNAEKKMKKLLKNKGEANIEALIAEYQDQSKVVLKATEEKCDQPTSRSNASLTPHPDKEQLILFGGEFFTGSKTFMYNEMYFYNIKTNSWTVMKAPAAPPPRSSHQAVTVKQGGGQFWMFGGEFASPSQSQFYHYKDLWLFHFHSNKWEKVSVPGGPSSRSGHRMVACKRNLFVFGGFHDNLKGGYQVFNDMHVFNLDTYTWSLLQPTGHLPPPRSGCCLAVTQDEKQIVMFGGYSKKSVKKDVDRGTIHTDMYVLGPDAKTEGGWSWSEMKQSGARPTPRCSCAVVGTPGNRALVFGGVVDNEDDEDIEGKFYNDMYSVELDKGRWHQVQLRGKKVPKEKKRRRKKKGDEAPQDVNMDSDDSLDEDLDTLAVSEQQTQASSSGVFTVTQGATATSAGTGGLYWPCGRMNAMLAVRQGVLYMFGGMYEDGDKQLTLQDMYALDLHKLEEWKVLIHNEADKLIWESESESSDDEDESGSDDDESGSDEEDEEMEDMEEEAPAPLKRDEALNDYFSRTKDHWLDKAEEMATKEGLDVTVKQLKKAAFRMAEDYLKRTEAKQ